MSPSERAVYEFKRLLRGADDPTLTVYDFEHEGEAYIVTDGTGDGVFIYVAFDVEMWAETYEPREGLTAYDDFVQAVDMVDDLNVARAAYTATGLIACSRSCKPLLLTENERAYPTCGFWGTGAETYYVNAEGIWCVQSPDLDATGGRPTRVECLPDTTTRLLNESCADVDISDCGD